MNDFLEVIFKAVLIGVGATAIMDVWLLVLKMWNVPTLNFALLGRWVGHLFRGRWFHAGIGKSESIKNELAIGWLVHYAIGIGFACILIAIFGVSWMQHPSWMPAVFLGMATAIAPLFIMQPAMGSGIASSKTAAPLRNCLKSVINHIVFGGGLYFSASILAIWC